MVILRVCCFQQYDVYIYIYMHVCMYVRTYVCMYVCMYVCIYVCVYVCIYVSMYLRIYVSMYLCIYLCMHLCICAFVHLCIPHIPTTSRLTQHFFPFLQRISTARQGTTKLPAWQQVMFADGVGLFFSQEKHGISRE